MSNIKVNETDTSTNFEGINIIDPNKSILKTYQKNVLYFNNLSVKKESLKEDYNLTDKGKNAYRVLKNRYIQIFLLPTAMNNLSPHSISKIEHYELSEPEIKKRKLI